MIDCLLRNHSTGKGRDLHVFSRRRRQVGASAAHFRRGAEPTAAGDGAARERVDAVAADQSGDGQLHGQHNVVGDVARRPRRRGQGVLWRQRRKKDGRRRCRRQLLRRDDPAVGDEDGDGRQRQCLDPTTRL